MSNLTMLMPLWLWVLPQEIVLKKNLWKNAFVGNVFVGAALAAIESSGLRYALNRNVYILSPLKQLPQKNQTTSYGLVFCLARSAKNIPITLTTTQAASITMAGILGL